jgi:hypothetical protein
MKKSLNEYLFDALERVSNADNTTINTEVNKAHSIISISQQVIDNVKVKIELAKLMECNIELPEISSDPQNPVVLKTKLLPPGKG